MHPEIVNTGALHGALKRSPYPAAGGHVIAAARPLIWPTIGAPEYFALATRKVRQLGHKVTVQRYTARATVFGFRKADMRAAQVNASPVQPKRLAGAGAGIQQKHDKRPKVGRHTWATWHFAENRDLIALKTLGGWQTLAMVTRYAHANTDNYREGINALPSFWENSGKPGKVKQVAA